MSDSIGNMRQVWWAYAVMGLLLFLPHVFSHPGRDKDPRPTCLGLPRVYGGDEPHYLLQLNSVLHDGDLDLVNNYRNLHAGALDGGHFWAGRSLTPNTGWYRDDGEYRCWHHVYDVKKTWVRDGKVTYRTLPGADTDIVPPHQYSTRPAGLAIFSAPFLFPFRDSAALESAAVVLSGLVTLLALFGFRALVRPLCKSEWHTALVVATTFLTTPLWHYGRTFFTEPYTTCAVVWAFTLSLRFKRHALAGCALSVGAIMKPPIMALAGPLMFVLLWRRDWKSCATLGLPCLVGVSVVLWLNHVCYGSIWNTPQPWTTGSVSRGLAVLLLSLNHGLIWFAPVVLMLPAAMYRMLRDQDDVCVACVMGAVGYILFMSAWHLPEGGFSYGPRLIVPVIPLIFASLPAVRRDVLWGILALSGFGISIFSVMPYWTYFSQHPVFSLLLL